MSNMLEAYENVPLFDISIIDDAEQLGIIEIKDFSSVNLDELVIPFNDTYLVRFKDGTYTPLTCSKETLNTALHNL